MGRQIEPSCAPALDRLAHAGNLVGAEIIDDDDITLVAGGARTFSTQVRKMLPFMAQAMTKGAVIPRRAATPGEVFQ